MISDTLLEKLYGPGIKNLPDEDLTEVRQALSKEITKPTIETLEEAVLSGKPIPQTYINAAFRLLHALSNNNNILEEWLRQNAYSPLKNLAGNAIPLHPTRDPLKTTLETVKPECNISPSSCKITPKPSGTL